MNYLSHNIRWAIGSLLLMLALAACKEGSKPTAESYTLTTDELSMLQSGDIIMRMGHGAFSASIAALFSDTLNLSHCGIVVRNGNKLSVIHTVSPSLSDTDGMQQCTMQEFINDSRPNSIAAVRFKQGNGQRIAAKAAYYLQKQLPFDSRFSLADTSSLFCSELPIKILRDEFGFDALQGKEPLVQNCKFSIFFAPQHFDRLIYHLNR